MTAASCSWELSSRREDFATWLCWHGCDVRTGLTTCRNVCFQASFSSLIKTTQARLASPPAEPQNCIHVPSGRKRAKLGDAHKQNVTRLQQWAEGTAAGWHQAGMAPASPAASFTTRALFGLERCAMPARSAMFPHGCDAGGGAGSACMLPSTVPGRLSSLLKHTLNPELGTLWR